MRCPVHRRFFVIRSPFEYFLVFHFVHTCYPYDRPLMSHHDGMQLFHLSAVHCPGLGSMYTRVDSTVARYILPLTRTDTWWLFQSLWRSWPKVALSLAILLCISSAMLPLLDIVHSRTEFSLFPPTMISSFRVLVEFGWYRTSVFLILMFRPNVFDASEKASAIFCIYSAVCASRALASANSSSLISIRVVMVFALKYATLNRSAFSLDCM